MKVGHGALDIKFSLKSEGDAGYDRKIGYICNYFNEVM